MRCLHGAAVSGATRYKPYIICSCSSITDVYRCIVLFFFYARVFIFGSWSSKKMPWQFKNSKMLQIHTKSYVNVNSRRFRLNTAVRWITKLGQLIGDFKSMWMIWYQFRFRGLNRVDVMEIKSRAKSTYFRRSERTLSCVTNSWALSLWWTDREESRRNRTDFCDGTSKCTKLKGMVEYSLKIY